MSTKKIGRGFNHVIGNPPYKRDLHQRIFNLCYGLLESKGSISFIQPSSTIHNHTLKPCPAHKEMQEILNNNYSEVRLVSSAVFKDAFLATDACVYTVIKDKPFSLNKIDHVTFKNKKQYKNVSIDNISLAEIEPEIYESIHKKYVEYIKKHGSVKELYVFNKFADDKNYIKVARIRGNKNSEGELQNNYFTHFSDKNIVDKKRHNSMIECPVGCEQNAYKYLSSVVSRFGLAMLKFNLDFKYDLVPLVSFDKVYTDSELFKMLNLTESEIHEMHRVIKPWSYENIM